MVSSFAVIMNENMAMYKIKPSFFWGKDASFTPLLIAGIVLLFTLLGGRSLWTQEHRWAGIVLHMLTTHDYWHPILNDKAYYDKPLLSYWLIAGVAHLMGGFSNWSLRFPSALAGLLALWSTYRLGVCLQDKRLGLLAGWLLLTTFYFVFWARVSSADMLNVAGSLFAITWYFLIREQAHICFKDYFVFFIVLSLTALCKGLVGPVIVGLGILPDLLRQNGRHYMNKRLFFALLFAVIIYMLPFLASNYFSHSQYHHSGLQEVYRENVVRYFQPFDHKGGIYTYFIFLPIYLLPWTVFFIPALCMLPRQWQHLSPNFKSIVWSFLLLFLFFTFSGSRRSYYVLPLVPFAILITANWILAASSEFSLRAIWTARGIVIFFVVLFLHFALLQPWYYAHHLV